MSYLLIANIFSFISACFTILSSFTKSPKRTYLYQVGQCLMYAFAAYFFGVYATIAIMLISSCRNVLVAYGKYNRVWMVICAAVSLVVGLLVNSGSIPGYISIVAAVSYAIMSYYLKNPKAVKVNVIVNLSLWLASDLIICDVPSAIVDTASIILAIVTIFRILKDERKYNEEN